MNKLKSRNNELVKHSSAIHINNTISVIERKISNILLKKAFVSLSIKDRHIIRMKEIMQLLGWASDDNYEVIKNALKKLNITQIEWNILGKDKKNEWGITTIISSAKIKNGVCEYSYSPVLRDLLAVPNIYAKLNMIVQARFTSKHSLALWEFLMEVLCSASSNCVTTNWIDISVIKKMLGVDNTGVYKEFKTFNRDVLKKAVVEVNNISDIEAKCMYKRSNRKVVSVAFFASKKQNYDYFPIGLEHENEGNKESIYNVDGGNSNLIEQLKEEFNFSHKVAQKFVLSYSEEKIKKVIEYVRGQLSSNKIKKLPAYFMSALEGDWDLDPCTTAIDSYKHSIINSEVEKHLQMQKSPWKEILFHLRDTYGILVYHAWFSKITFANYDEDNNLLQIKTDTVFYRDWIESNYKQKIFDVARLVIPQINDIEIR